MITTELKIPTEFEPYLESLPGRIKRAGDKLIEDFAQMLSDRVKDALKGKLVGWKASPEVLAKYPLMGNPAAFAQVYCACIEVETDEEAQTVHVFANSNTLRGVGIVPEAAMELEFGSSIMPNFPHWYAVASWVKGNMSTISDKMGEIMLEEMESG